MNKSRIILSLGGSLIHPTKGINITFLKDFNRIIREYVGKGKRFIIVCGGGALCRVYQNAAKITVGQIPDEDVDWLGIHVTKLNAQLLRTLFADLTIPQIIFKYDKLPRKVDKPILIAAGWKPGWSTDYCATLLAKQYKAGSIINLSNIEQVHDKDPNKYPDAKPIDKISWEEFEGLVGDKWNPGANVPFDPIATKLAKKLNLAVYIIKGSNIFNFEKVLEGQSFKGTVIMPLRLSSSFYDKSYYEHGIGYSGYTTTLTGNVVYHLVNLYRALKIKFLLKPKSLLDVGCGIGLLVYYLRKMGVEAYGIEISNYAISKSPLGIRKYLTIGNILHLPYKDNSFDIVTTVDVLQHLHKDDIAKALKECNRVCNRLSGHKIYTLENKWIKHFHSTDLSHRSVHSRGWWFDLFKKENFKIAEFNYPTLPSIMETIFILKKRIKKI